MKRLNVHLFIALSFIFIPLLSSGQNSYVPGYYVNDKKDTVRGFIEYRSNWKMTDYIKFRKGLDSQPVQLSPKYTIAVVVEDKTFFEAYPFGKTNAEGDQEVYGFFKKIITGKISLYAYGYDRYFIRKGNGPVREVTRSKRRFWSDEVEVDYRGLVVLKIQMRDCPSYTEADLVKDYKKTLDFTDIIGKYNSCFPSTSPQVVHSIVKPGSHWAFGVHGSIGGMKHAFASSSQMSGADFGTNVTGTAGIFVSVFHPNIGDNFRVVFEPGIGKYSGYSFFEDQRSGNDLYLRYTFLRSPLVVRYVRNRVFFDFGWTNFVVLKQNNTWRYEQHKDSPSPVLTSSPAYNLKSNFAGITLGVGGKAELAGRSIFTSVRFSNLFPSASKQYNQPSQMWLDVNLAIQITR